MSMFARFAARIESLESRVLFAIGGLTTPHTFEPPDLANLTPDLRAATLKYQHLANSAGANAVVTSTHRSVEYQRHLYEIKTKFEELDAVAGMETKLLPIGSGRPQLVPTPGTPAAAYAALATQVNQEILDHTLVSDTAGSPKVAPPSASRHNSLPAEAVDISTRSKTTGAVIPQATVDELAKKAGLYRPYPVKDKIHFELIPADIVFVIDTTGSMDDDIEAVKQSATQIISEAHKKDSDTRIGIVLFQDFPDQGTDYVSMTALPLTKDEVAANAAIQSITVGGGGDTPEAVYSGLMHAIRGEKGLGKWHEGRKNIILLGDAPGKDPEPNTGYTLASVSAAALKAGATLGAPLREASLLVPAAAAAATDEPDEANEYVPEELDEPRVDSPETDGASPADIFAVLIGDDFDAEQNFTAVTAANRGALFRADDAEGVVQGVLGAIAQAGDVAPIALDDEAAGASEAPIAINVLANDSDPDGTINAASVALLAAPANGTVTVDPATGTMTYTSAQGFVGTDTFTYTVGDNAGLPSAPATVSVTVNPNRVLIGPVGPKSVFRDADGTAITVRLKGPGAVNVFDDGGKLDLEVTGTGGVSSLTIRGKGGNGVADVDDIAVAGPLKALTAPGLNLTGTLSINGNTSKVSVGSITGGTVAAPNIGSLTVKGSVSGARVLAGAMLGADGKFNGSGDSFAAGVLGTLKVGGSVASSVIEAGLDPVDRQILNGNDVLLPGGAVNSVLIRGGADDATTFVASAFGKNVRVGRQKGGVGSDARFRTSL
jgi:Mg-chelatase subunit ChlD